MTFPTCDDNHFPSNFTQGSELTRTIHFTASNFLLPFINRRDIEHTALFTVFRPHVTFPQPHWAVPPRSGPLTFIG